MQGNINKQCKLFRRKYHAEVAQRPKAPVLKTGCATHSGSSNLPLGVSISNDFSLKVSLSAGGC